MTVEATYERLARRSSDDDLARLLTEHRAACDRAQAEMGMHATICSAIYDEQRRRLLTGGLTPEPGSAVTAKGDSEPGACEDPSCPVLHADPANPIHPPFYEPGGPFVEIPKWLSTPPNESLSDAANSAEADRP
jgi:hypothetical protein